MNDAQGRDTLPTSPDSHLPPPTAGRRGLPLFFRIFAVVLGAVLCAQALNLASVFLVRLPEPQIHLLSDIADALRSGQGQSPLLTASIGEPPVEADQDERDLQIRSLLAGRLGMDEQLLRVSVSRPPQFYRQKDIEGLKPGRTAKSFEAKAGDAGRRADLIIGRFTAALRLPDGQWRLVNPTGGAIEPWQWQSLLWLLGTLLIATPLAWMISRRIAAPVDLFSAAAERLGRDPTVPPLLPIKGPPEIAAAVIAFNTMQARLKRYVDDRTTMVAAIAHDLRTPLMRLTLLLEDAPVGMKLSAQAEIKEMTDRIRSALGFVRDGSQPVRRQRLDLRTLVESVADEMVDRGADVAIAPGDDAVVDADVAGLRALFVNLVENAVRYANGAHLALRRTNGQVLVEVADHGPGIPERELERMFEPFYRLESSRNRATGGTGLGLASARAVARAHGGDVTLVNRPEGGLVAIVSLPLGGPY